MNDRECIDPTDGTRPDLSFDADKVAVVCRQFTPFHALTRMHKPQRSGRVTNKERQRSLSLIIKASTVKTSGTRRAVDLPSGPAPDSFAMLHDSAGTPCPRIEHRLRIDSHPVDRLRFRFAFELVRMADRYSYNATVLT